MSYLLRIPKTQMESLWQLREYAGCGPIAVQVREAVRMWIEEQERRIGTTTKDLVEAIERHEQGENQLKS